MENEKWLTDGSGPPRETAGPLGSSGATCSTENRQTPYFERRNGENVALVIDDRDEFGDAQRTRHLLSEKTAKRLLSELADFL